jgi:SAM-dependent methyltransferase
MNSAVGQLGEMRTFERSKWDDYFAEALAGRGQEHEQTLWWRLSDDDTIDIVGGLFAGRRDLRILEVACGSGGTNFRLARALPVRDISLLDVSANALRFARTLRPPTLPVPVHFIGGDAFNLPVADGAFDLVWNVGTIEHYPADGIRQMVREMRRVTRPGGWMAVAMPNRCSIAVLKAWLLGTRFGRSVLRGVPGYRFDTEILYGNEEVARLIEEETGSVRVAFAGNCLWAGAPEGMVRLTNRWLSKSRLSFLTFFLSQRAGGAGEKTVGAGRGGR